MVAAHAGRGRMRTMQTIITLTAVGIVAAIAALWWFILARLLPLYQSGALPARARSLFHLATALLCWVSALAVAYIGFGSNEAATMITVLAAIGLLSWGLLSTVRRGPRVGPLHAETQAAEGPPRASTVRTQPHVQGASGPRSFVPAHPQSGRVVGRSSRSQAVMRKGA